MIKIGDLFDIEKGSVQSSKCVGGQYDFITASEEWKTHNEYTHECEALIFAMGASGSLGRTHYVNGKFVTSDLCFILTPKNKYKDKLNLRFYYYYFNTFREKIVSATATGTSKLAINRKMLSDYKIHYIDIDKQIALIGKIEAMQEVSKSIVEKVTIQGKYVSSLRQAILQQAVEGKLCEQDPTDEPASVLLEKIKAEKEKLIAEKKIKKQKNLPPITEEEKPFDLPLGWEWCRLRELIQEFPRNGFSPNRVDYATNTKVLTLTATTSGVLDLQQYKYVEDRIKPDSYLWIQKDDVLIQRSNSIKYVGTVCLCEGFTKGYIYPDLMMKFQFLTNVNVKLLVLFLNSGYVKKYFQSKATGTSNSMKKITQSIVANTTLPLPPLLEQQRIVEKVDRLMTLCDNLEQEVKNAKKYASQLMPAVLEEAFSSKQVRARDNVVVFAPQLQQANKPKPVFAAAARGKMREDTWHRITEEAIKLASEEI